MAHCQTGKFKMISSDNFGEYLKAVGVGMIQRNLAEKAKPTVEISESNGRYTLKTLTAFKNTEINFALGEEFDKATADVRQTKKWNAGVGNILPPGREDGILFTKATSHQNAETFQLSYKEVVSNLAFVSCGGDKGRKSFGIYDLNHAILPEFEY